MESVNSDVENGTEDSTEIDNKKVQTDDVLFILRHVTRGKMSFSFCYLKVRIYYFHLIFIARLILAHFQHIAGDMTTM